MSDLFYGCLVIGISIYLSVDRYCDMKEKIDDNQYEDEDDFVP